MRWGEDHMKKKIMYAIQKILEILIFDDKIRL